MGCVVRMRIQRVKKPECVFAAHAVSILSHNHTQRSVPSAYFIGCNRLVRRGRRGKAETSPNPKTPEMGRA